jgi:hypothetical protein
VSYPDGLRNLHNTSILSLRVYFALEEERDRAGDRAGKGDPVAGTEGPKSRRRTAETLGHPSPPDRLPELSDRSGVSQDHATPTTAMPESGAQREAEGAPRNHY